MLKLPRELETGPRREALEQYLNQDLRPLWANGTINVPHVTFLPALEKALGEAKRDGFLERGLENIEALLRREEKGLAAVREKQGTAPANRVSRLLIIPGECTERFYRNCEALLFNHADRLLGLRVDISYEKFGDQLFGSGSLVKAILISDRKAVARVLAAQLDLSV